ncbi:HAMP domain-containing sensor histidine kinase [Aquabacterium sp.]|uniref:sensor histidine kinase n=1 Tax=Aquabacterium sp. TaxID=1872578 RepID=UPI00199D336B|nr:HAMP domain-containing sensor histidine kinase [Aquabacterium sp.]MBC7698837.1 HAMP domain-containing histidine kinase [Aquabacterium sp.]
MTGVSLLAAIGTLLIWFTDRQQGLTTAWDQWTIPMLSALYFGISVLHVIKPRCMPWALPPTLIATSVYLLVALHLAMVGQSLPKLYAATSLTQLIPVFYVIAFVSWPRGGAGISGLTYAGLLAQYLFSLHAPMPAGGWSDVHQLTQKTLLASVVIHPACILALSFITHLRGQLSTSQQEAFKGKERFLAMLSHEIRTPLQAMLGSIDLLALKLHGSTETRALDRLRNSATQLDTHLRDITEFTRLEDPALRIQADTFDLTQLLQDLRDDWIERAQSKGLTLSIDIAPDEQTSLQTVTADATRVRQIVSNLISNALKYTMVGGVTVHASLSRQQRGRAMTIVVEDSGIGIAAHHLAAIFQPYVRLEDARALRVDGSGLGLAVVQRLVDRLGGRLHVDSHPDRGSRFTVELPMADNG